MSANDKYKIYTAGEIRKYLDGELTAADMHALEAAALEDPFLADALEGMEKDRLQRGGSALPNDLVELRKRLQDRVTKKDKAIILPLYRSWWKIAVSVIVIIGLALFSSHYFFGNHATSTLLGKSERPAVASSAPASVSPSPPAGADSNDVAKTTLPKKATATQNQPAALYRATFKKDAGTAGSGVADNEIRRNKTVEANYEKLKMDSTHLSLSRSAGYANASKSFGDSGLYKTLDIGQDRRAFSFKTQKLNKFLFVGKVIDSNDNPIPYATISFSSHHLATRTDNNGLFQFQLLGSKDSLAPVWVTSVGYHPVSLTINALTLANNNALSNVIRLQPETSELNEVVTIGYGTQKKKSAKQQESYEDKRDKNSGNMADKEADLVQRAAPVNGWAAYQNYLTKNRPLKGVDSTLKGTEIIYFEVDRKGRLTSFKVTQSLSPAHDSAIIQLIRQGPVWKPLEGKKASATLTMSF